MAQQPTIALIGALHDEIAPTIKRLGLVGTQQRAMGQVAGQAVVAAATGIGRQRIASQLALLLEKYPVTKVIHLGVSGALNPQLRSGQVLRIDRVMNERGDAIQLTDAPEPLQATSLLTVEHPVCSVEAKRLLFAKFAAEAVDMETYHVAALLRDCAVELIALRAISDVADVALPAASIGWVRDDGSTNGLAAGGYLLGHPRQLPTLLKLRRTMKLGVRQLAEAVDHLLTDPT